MENLDKFVDFAPLIVVILMFIWQNNLFVKPEALEKKHREILEDTEKKFVTWTAFNAFKEQVNKIDQNVEMLCEYVMKHRKEEE